MLRITIILATAFCAVIAGRGVAADLPPEVDSGEIGPIGVTQGWYLRGDLGYNFHLQSPGRPAYRSYDAVADNYSTSSFDRARFGRYFSVAAGVGYQFNDFFRTDLTVDYFTGTLKANTGWGGPCGASGCRYDRQSFSALGLLANAYADLGTYQGITPYLGGGLGMTNLGWNTVRQSACTANSCTPVDLTDARMKGLSSWRVTYALMAGASYDISAHTKLDLGYRYSRIAGGDMFGFGNFEERLGATGAKGRDKGFSRHEFRLGLRLTTW